MPTTSLIALFFWSFIVGFGAVVSPGPVSTAIVSHTPRQGWLVGPLVATGHSIMELIITILIFVGLSAGLANHNVQIGIALLGGLLLLWMGTTMIWDVSRQKTQLPGSKENLAPMSRWQLVRLGILTTLSNPFWYAWWVTVAAGYILQAKTLGVASVAAFYFGHISADYLWDTGLSTIIVKGGKWITNSVYRGILIICGGFFIYLGIQFLLQGFSSFLQ